jgi:polyhydroxybutyrate depolymerase
MRPVLGRVLVACVLVTTTAASALRGAAETTGKEADRSSGCQSGEVAAVDGEGRTLTVGTDARTYLIDAPAGPADRPLPVVLVFHGFKGSGASQRAAGFGALARRAGFIAIHPDGHEGVRLLGTIGRGWDLGVADSRDLDFVRALLDRLEAERCVDRRRIYATGMSNGAFFANLLGCRMADRIAAIAPVAGGMALPACTPAQPVAVLMIFGSADDIISPDVARGARDWWAHVEGCSGRAERDGCTHYDGCRADLTYCEGPQAHAWPADATDQIWRFFTTHSKR